MGSQWQVQNRKKRIDTITRTIRINVTIFDKVEEIAKKNNISFNNVMNQIIEHGLQDLKE